MISVEPQSITTVTADGSTFTTNPRPGDDTMALQTALDILTTGGTIVLPDRPMQIRATLKGSPARCPHIVGSARTDLQWKAPSMITPADMFDLPNWRNGVVTGFCITASKANPMRSVFRCYNGSQSVLPPSANLFALITAEGIDGGLQCFLNLDKVIDANNELHVVDSCEVSNYTGAAIAIGHSMALDITAKDCRFYANRGGLCAIAGSPDGSKGAMSNFYVVRGYSGGHTKADYYLNSAPRGSSIRDGDGENSARFIVTDGPSGAPLGMVVDNTRWACDGAAADGEFVQWRYPGPLTIRDCPDLGGNYKMPLAIRWEYVSGYARPVFNLQNSRIACASLSFPGSKPTNSDGSSIQTSDTTWSQVPTS